MRHTLLPLLCAGLIALSARGDDAPAPQVAPAAPAAPSAPAAQPAAQPAGVRIAAKVDPTVEFLSAVARNAGFEEYRMKNAASPYAQRVDALLKPHLEHPAFEQMRIMRREHGMSYDAVMSLAMHLGPPPALVERVDFDARPPRLDARLETRGTRRLVAQLRDLATQCLWADFVAKEAAFYAQAAASLESAANRIALLPWFDRTLGVRQGAAYELVPGLLNGGGNYGVGIQFVDGTPERIRPVIGCDTWDAQGVPVFGEDLAPLLAHELCHSYTNAVVDRHLKALQPAGERLFAGARRSMERQAYGDARTVLYETLVRACVVRCMLDVLGPEAASKQSAEEVSRGFKWVPALAQALGEYEANRARYADLDAFVPRIVEVLEQEGAKAEKASALAPKVLRISPEVGAKDLPPGKATLRIEFDRPMRTDAYSIVGSPANTPALAGKPTIDQERIFTWEMTLEPGRTYRFSLNGGKFRSFRSRDGVELEPYEVEFTTAAK